MSAWRDVRLKEVCEKITVGHVGSMAGEYTEKGIPFLRSLNIKPYRISFEDLKFINDEFNSKLRKSELFPGDVAVVRTGYPGTAAVIPENLGKCNCSDLVIIRPGKSLNPHFIAAIFNSNFGKTLVSGNLVGAAQQHFNITVAKELKLKIPPRWIQDKIAAVLTAYDDLIENNKRRIALLEKMAEEIYREWFVRMRFPGHEKSKMVKGVPKGWRIKELVAVCDEVRKGIKKKNLSGYEKYIGLEHIPRKSILVSEFSLSSSIDSDKLVFQNRDILFGKIRPYLHKVSLTHFSGVCSTDAIVIRPKEKIFEGFLLFTVFSETFIDLATTASTGTKMPRADWDFLKRLKVSVPSEDLLEKFQSVFNNHFSQMVFLADINRFLMESRNLLLPRLISGKLNIEKFDIQFPPSMFDEAASHTEKPSRVLAHA